MAKLRHVAIAVPDPEKSARFYEKVFGLKRVGTTDSELASGVYLSDGVVSLWRLAASGEWLSLAHVAQG